MSSSHPFSRRIPARAMRGARRAAGTLGLAAALYAAVAGAVNLARAARRYRAASDTLYRRWTSIPALAGAGRLRIHARLRDVMTNAEPIVLVHGLGIGSACFVPLAARLSHYAPVYAPDLPGHGASDHDARPLGVPELARSLAAWMESMGLRRATLVGQSLGCRIAAHAATAHPELASRLILIGPPTDAAARPRGDVPRGETHGMLDDRLQDVLPRVACPAFLVHGDRDRIDSRRWAEELARIARAPKPMVVPGWGHAVHHDDPDTLAVLIVALGMRSDRERRAP